MVGYTRPGAISEMIMAQFLIGMSAGLIIGWLVTMAAIVYAETRNADA
jgi:hypothetical protein